MFSNNIIAIYNCDYILIGKDCKYFARLTAETIFLRASFHARFVTVSDMFLPSVGPVWRRILIATTLLPTCPKTSQPVRRLQTLRLIRSFQLSRLSNGLVDVPHNLGPFSFLFPLA